MEKPVSSLHLVLTSDPKYMGFSTPSNSPILSRHQQLNSLLILTAWNRVDPTG